MDRDKRDCMKILNLAVAGFRSLAGVKWQPGNLNLIIGPNASGKSNLVRLLEMLSISAQGGLGKYVQREGGIEPLLWDGAVDGIEISVKLSPSESQRDQQWSHTDRKSVV